MRLLTSISCASLAVLAATVGGAPGSAAVSGCGLSGAFREYSARIAYKAGGSSVMPTSTRQLALSGSTWRFGSSSGRFHTAPITAADWKKWGASPYGPTAKIVLSGWSGATADGPIETEGSVVDFFWVIYPAKPPTVSQPALIELKFGHAVLSQTCGGSTSKPPAGKGTLTVTPSTIAGGQTVHVVAKGFQPNEGVSVTETYTLNGSPHTTSLGDGKADSSGTLAFDRDTFAGGITQPGVHTICAVGAISKVRACGSYTVTSG